MSYSLLPYGLRHARPPCPSPTPGACSNSCPLSRWCYPTISSSVIPFSSCLQYFLASRSFPVSQFFTSGGQGIGVSASASVHTMNIQDWFPLGLTGCISLQSKGLSNLLQHHSSKASVPWCSAFFRWKMWSVCACQVASIMCNSMDCSQPGFSVHGILQARTLEWVAMPSSRGPSLSRDQTCISYISCIGRHVPYC